MSNWTAAGLWIAWSIVAVAAAVLTWAARRRGLDCGCPNDGRTFYTCRTCDYRRCDDHYVHQCAPQRTGS